MFNKNIIHFVLTHIRNEFCFRLMISICIKWCSAWKGYIDNIWGHLLNNEIVPTEFYPNRLLAVVYWNGLLMLYHFHTHKHQTAWNPQTLSRNGIEWVRKIWHIMERHDMCDSGAKTKAKATVKMTDKEEWDVDQQRNRWQYLFIFFFHSFRHLSQTQNPHRINGNAQQKSTHTRITIICDDVKLRYYYIESIGNQ